MKSQEHLATIEQEPQLGFVGYDEFDDFAKSKERIPLGYRLTAAWAWSRLYNASKLWFPREKVAHEKLHSADNRFRKPVEIQSFIPTLDDLKQQGIEVYEVGQNPSHFESFAFVTRDGKLLEMFRYGDQVPVNGIGMSDDDSVELNLDALAEAMSDEDFFRSYMLNRDIKSAHWKYKSEEEQHAVQTSVDSQIRVLHHFLETKSRSLDQAA